MRRHRLAIVFALVLCGFWLSRLSGALVCCDAYDTLRMAVNLAHHGTMSLDVTPPFTPSMYREPVPALAAAAMVALVDVVAGRSELAAYLQGERARWIKAHNVLWMLALWLTTYLAIAWFTGSPLLAIGGAVVAQAVFFLKPTRAWGIDSLYTELPAAAMLMLGSLLLARAASRAGWAWMGSIGITFGLLALVKASVLYVFAGVVAGFAVLWAVRHGREDRGRAVAGVCMLVIGFGVVVTPWLVRNFQTFGRLAISDRGGRALRMRALMSEGIWPSTFLGSFYVWTPGAARPAIGALTGFGPADLRRGARLEGLNTYPESGFLAEDQAAMIAGRPEDAISYFYGSIAEATKVERQLAAAGVSNPGLAADDVLMRRALAQVWAHPFTHLAMTAPFLWRGAMLTFPLLVAVLAFALRRRDDELLLFCLPSFGLVLFYALLSPFEPRYGLAVVPVAIVGACVLGRSLALGRSRALQGR